MAASIQSATFLLIKFPLLFPWENLCSFVMQVTNPPAEFASCEVLPGDYFSNPNATGHGEEVKLLKQLLWVKCSAHPGAASCSTGTYCLCFSIKSSSIFSSVIGKDHTKALGRTQRVSLLKNLSESLRLQSFTFYQDAWRYVTAWTLQSSGLLKHIYYVAWEEIPNFLSFLY